MSENFEVVLEQHGVLKTGHFQLTSGLHSGQYFEKFRILEYPALVSKFALRIVREFQNKDITVVCGPTTGGTIIAFEVARQMGARCVMAEKAEAGGRKIGRGFEIKESDRVLLVDDVLTTGGSIQDTLDALKQFPGTLAGIAVFIDRSEKLSLPMPVFPVFRQAVQNYRPADCPFCRQGIPLAVPGGKAK